MTGWGFHHHHLFVEWINKAIAVDPEFWFQYPLANLAKLKRSMVKYMELTFEGTYHGKTLLHFFHIAITMLALEYMDERINFLDSPTGWEKFIAAMMILFFTDTSVLAMPAQSEVQADLLSNQLSLQWGRVGHQLVLHSLRVRVDQSLLTAL